MSDINEILNTIQAAVDQFTGTLTNKEKEIHSRLLNLLKDLQTKSDGALVSNINNYKKILFLKAKLERFIIDEKYKKDVSTFLKTYDVLVELNNKYFSQFNANFSPKQTLKQLTKVAIESTASGLAEIGIQVALTDAIKKILFDNIQSGNSYAQMTEQLRNLLNPVDGEGPLSRYLRTYTVTSLNQFSAEYNYQIAQDLNLEWYTYTGSLLETSRPFCVKAVEKEYIHQSEFATILRGDFGKLGHVHVNRSTSLPDGLMQGTTPENFPRRRGGWNCGHQLIAVDDSVVPEATKDEVYATAAYQAWAVKNGKKVKRPAQKI